MKKVWIFLLIAIVLIAWTMVRERFEPTASIQAPPYDKADKIRIFGLLDNTDQAFLMAKVKSEDATNGGVYESLSTKAGLSNDEKAKLQEAKNALEEKAGGLLTPSIEKFYYDVFKSASVPITLQKIDTFLTTDTNTSVSKEMIKRVLSTYFISQAGVSGNSTYNSILTGLGQGQGYLNNGPTGSSAGSSSAGPTGSSSTGPTGSSAATGPTGNVSQGEVARTGGRLHKLFGPIFRGFGEEGPQGLVDSTKTNPYPELLGGRGGKWGSEMGSEFKGSLPSSAGLGSDANSQYFPYSRQPGDMDLIQDPYRVSQQFASSSYSFKTEPVPFLTDFSAFQK